MGSFKLVWLPGFEVCLYVCSFSFSESENGLPWLEHCLHWSYMLLVTIPHKVKTLFSLNFVVICYMIFYDVKVVKFKFLNVKSGI